MTADHDKTENPPPADVQVDVAAAAPMISRRMLLRGASAAVPTILTLNSGVAAAAAAASNMIAINPAAGPQSYVDASGQYDGYMCVHTGYPAAGSKMDLGVPPMAEVYVIPDDRSGAVEYRAEDPSFPGNWGKATYTAAKDMCAKPGKYLYKLGEADPQPLKYAIPKNAGMASAAALASFSSVVDPYYVF